MRQMRLNSVTNTRRTFARLMREYLRGDIDERTAKTLTYMMGVFLQSFKLEKEEAMQGEIDELRKQIEEVREEMNHGYPKRA